MVILLSWPLYTGPGKSHLAIHSAQRSVTSSVSIAALNRVYCRVPSLNKTFLATITIYIFLQTNGIGNNDNSYSGLDLGGGQLAKNMYQLCTTKFSVLALWNSLVNY